MSRRRDGFTRSVHSRGTRSSATPRVSVHVRGTATQRRSRRRTATNTVRVNVFNASNMEGETSVAFLAAFTAGLRVGTGLPPRSNSADFGVYEPALSLSPLYPSFSLAPPALPLSPSFSALPSLFSSWKPPHGGARASSGARLLETPSTPTEGHSLHSGCKHRLHQWRTFPGGYQRSIGDDGTTGNWRPVP